MRRNQRQVEQVKIKLNMQMDDRQFQDIILKTQVRARGWLIISDI